MPIFREFFQKQSGQSIGGLAALIDRPLIWLLPFYLGGIWLGWNRPATGSWPLIVSAAAALAAAFPGKLPYFLRERAFLLLIPAVLALGWGLTSRSLIPPDDEHHLINFTEESGFSRPVVLGGVVLEGSGWRPGRNHRLVIEVREIIVPGETGPESIRQVTGKARVTVGGGAQLRVEVGDYIRAPLTLSRVYGLKNPGSADFAKYWGAQGVWVEGRVKSPWLVTSWAMTDKPFHSALSRWRNQAVQFIDRETSEPVSGLLAAQLVGRRSAVDLDTESTYRSLGLSHLLAVSGLHLGVWYGLCFWLTRQVLRRIKPLASQASLLAGALALIPALGYALLVGAASPVIRAAIMTVAVVLAALALKRSDPWNILAAAAWVLLLAEPYRLFTASFQLSFVATASMLAVFVPRPGGWKPSPEPANVWLRPVDKELFRDLFLYLTKGVPIPSESPGSAHQPRLKRKSFFCEALLAALAGTLGTAPLVIWHFGRIPLAGIAGNVIFTAILSGLVLIPGLMAMALLPLSPALAAWPLTLAEGVQAGLLPVMDSLARAAGPGWMLPVPGTWFLIAWFLAGWIWLRNSRPWKLRLALAAIILLAGMLPGLISGHGDRGVLRFTVLDVGQGSSVHINFPDGRQMVVDGGGTYNADPGDFVVTPYLLRQGIARLDVAALTHPDQDHLKGLVTVTKNFRPREIWDAPWPENYTPLYHQFRKASPDQARVDLRSLYEGRDFGGVGVSLLWPPPDLPRPDELNDAWVNGHGLILKLEWGEISFLITGDIQSTTERALVERYGRGLKTTVLLAPHHGGQSTLTPAFLKAVDPDWVVFAAGRNNSYGHPLPEIVRRAEEHGAKIRRTDLEGAAIFEVRKRDGRLVLEVKPPQ